MCWARLLRKGIAAGLTVAQIAAASGIRLATARTHLEQVFRKTGTAWQGQLVALLKGAVGPVD
jgi:DNA-binding CsgD family transcriptional regulator